jgi:hypothetical protein
MNKGLVTMYRRSPNRRIEAIEMTVADAENFLVAAPYEWLPVPAAHSFAPYPRPRLVERGETADPPNWSRPL